MAKKIVLGVLVRDRMQHVKQLQEIYSEYGCYIKTRLGLHEVTENVCSRNGLQILEMFGSELKITEMEDKLKSLEGLEVQKMVFEE